YTGIDLTDSHNFYLLQLFDNFGRDHGSSTAWRLDGTYTFDGGPLKYVEAGVRYEDRSAESQSTNPSPRGFPFQTISAASVPGLEIVTPGDFFKGDAAVGVGRYATPIPNFLLNNTNVLRHLLGYQGEPA